MKRGKYTSADLFITLLVVVAFVGSLVLSGNTLEVSTASEGYLLGDCSDTDGSKNVFEVGVTTGTNVSGELTNIADVCFSDTQVLEGYCSVGKVARNVIYCATGCNEGKCPAYK
jgi:hypothetical protein